LSSEQGTGTITGLLGEIVDDTMGFLDDLLARAHDVEMDARSAVTDLVDVDRGNGDGATGGDGHQADQMAALQDALSKLQAKVDELGRLRSKSSR
jgi:hypothetical protein